MVSLPGSHLAAPGEYQETIAKLINKYPNLENADYKPWREPREFASPSRLVVFEFSSDTTPGVAPAITHFRDINEVDAFLNTAGTGVLMTNPIRRLWILEGLDPSYVAVLGKVLDVDPRIWMRQQRINIWEKRARTAGDSQMLPSLAAQQRGFTSSYCQLMHLDYNPLTFTIRCAENERHIALTRRVGKDEVVGFDNVGVVHRKASIWSQILQNGGWNSLILVDESVKRILSGTRKKHGIVPTQQLPTPFQGGYQDFLPFATTEEAIQTKGPPRSSIYDDLCYYVQTHHKLLELSTGPKASTLFLYKIMASESALLVQYLNGVLNSLAWQLSRQNELRVFQSDWIEQRWSDLIAIQRRIGGYSDNIKETILSLEVGNSAKLPTSWKDSVTDFQWIDIRLLKLQEDTRSLVEAFSGLAGIVGNQQALSEARSVSYLNVLGMTFVPLSLIASILSLPTPYKPGASEYWKYWAIGIPIVIAVYAAWFLMTLILKKGARPSLATKLVGSIRQNIHGNRRGGGQAPASHSATFPGKTKLSA